MYNFWQWVTRRSRTDQVNLRAEHFVAAPVGNCTKLAHMVDWFVIVVISSTSFLFVLRVWAIFGYNRYILSFFLLSWLSVTGATSTIGIGLHGSAKNIGTTKYCMYTHAPPYISSSFIVPFIHDSLVFAAITWRLLQNIASDSLGMRKGIRMVIFGDYLPVFSRALLQDGQMYYLWVPF